jgi:hypothetical protein
VQTISEKWVQFQWPKDWANMEFMIDLSFLELIPIMLALYCWSDHFSKMKNALIEGIPLAQNVNNPNIDSSTMTLIFLTDNNFSKCDFSF